MTFKHFALLLAFFAESCYKSHGQEREKVVINSTDVVNVLFTEHLYIPPVIHDDWGKESYVEIAVRQFQQQILPKQFYGKSTVWGYGNPYKPNSFHHPSGTIEVTQNTKTTVKWVNELVKDPVACRKYRSSVACNYLTHIVKDSAGDPVVDTNLHWANPPKDCASGCHKTDCAGRGTTYKGPIPMVTHVHGAHVRPESDGYPEAWYLPCANNIPENWGTTGTFYRSLKTHRYLEEDSTSTSIGEVVNEEAYSVRGGQSRDDVFSTFSDGSSYGIFHGKGQASGNRDSARYRDDKKRYGASAGSDLRSGTSGFGHIPTDGSSRPYISATNQECYHSPGNAIFQYTNDQPTTTLWYHDHSLGLTERNAQAMGTGLWMIRTTTDGQSELEKIDCEGKRQKLPAPPVLYGQDPNKEHWDSLKIRKKLREIPIIIHPMGFYKDDFSLHPNGRNSMPNIMVVNGKAWPKLVVAQERYQFKLLFSAPTSSETLKISFSLNAPSPIGEDIYFYVIAGDQSLLPNVVKVNSESAKILSCGREEEFEYPTDPDLIARFKNGLPVVPAERYTIMLDFSKFPHGSKIYMNDLGEDIRFAEDLDPMGLLKQIMVFEVDKSYNNRAYGDTSTPPNKLRLKECPDFGKVQKVRDISTTAANTGGGPPGQFLLGTDGDMGPDNDMKMQWEDPIAIISQPYVTEKWTFWAWRGSHPMHVHQVFFKITERMTNEGRKIENGVMPWERGPKDVVWVESDYASSVKLVFDIKGVYVVHCHNLSHEDDEMMVPFCVGQPGVNCAAKLFELPTVCTSK